MHAHARKTRKHRRSAAQGACLASSPCKRPNPLPEGRSEPRLSALVVARNEEAILDDCLRRLAFVDEIVVVLDRCTDRSAEIARRYADTLIEGGWEIEGDRRNLGIRACSGEWVLEVDADERVDDALAQEVRAVVARDDCDVVDIPVKNYIGARHVQHGWSGSTGKNSYQGLFRKGVKWWGPARVHPHISVAGRHGPKLRHAVDHYIDRDISDMLRRLDRYTDFRARDLIDSGASEASLASLLRKTLSRFWKIYVVRQAYKEKELGFMVALYGAIYPLIAHIKAWEITLAKRGTQG